MHLCTINYEKVKSNQEEDILSILHRTIISSNGIWKKLINNISKDNMKILDLSHFNNLEICNIFILLNLLENKFNLKKRMVST